MDDTDRRLIALLRENARVPVAALAHLLKVSRGTVQNRIDRLTADGVIGGFTVRLKPDPTHQGDFEFRDESAVIDARDMTWRRGELEDINTSARCEWFSSEAVTIGAGRSLAAPNVTIEQDFPRAHRGSYLRE